MEKIKSILLMVLFFSPTIIAIIISCIYDRKAKKKAKIKREQYLKEQQEYIEKIKQDFQQRKPTQTVVEETKEQQLFFPYQKKYLLTKNEYNFYWRLKPIADKYGLQILTKIRLADLVETKRNLSYMNNNIYFNKIKSKHIDFALADNMKVVVLIELDDSSHNQDDRIERDIFVNDVLRKCNYILIRTYGSVEQIELEINKYRSKYVRTM